MTNLEALWRYLNESDGETFARDLAWLDREHAVVRRCTVARWRLLLATLVLA